MKRVRVILSLILLVSVFSHSALAAESRLEWMLGCWTTEDGSAREVWVRQSDNQFIGFGVALADGRLVFHEVLSISFSDGQAHYTAHPEGQAKTRFTAPTPRGKKVTFLNPDHDYPQRIDYRLEGPELRATISLLDGSQSNNFNKVRCD